MVVFHVSTFILQLHLAGGFDLDANQSEDQTSDYIIDIDPCVLDHIYKEFIKMENEMIFKPQEISAIEADDEMDIGDLEVFYE